MAPDISRRRFLRGLSVAGVVSVAGCTKSLGSTSDDPTTSTTTTDTTTPASTTTQQPTTESGEETDSAPAAMVRTYIEASAADPVTAQDYFHPIHPFHPDNLSEEKAEQLLSKDGELDRLELDTEVREVPAETVLAAPILRMQEVERSAVVGALDGQRTAVVDVTVWMADDRRDNYEIIAVTHDGEWVVLAQAVEVSNPDAPFEGRVVSDVTFDTENDTARVYFDESPTAQRITAKSKNTRSSRSSTTPENISYFDVGLDPEGDELLVTATVNGETRPVHQEQYPPSERAVEDVAFDFEDGSSATTARVTFTGTQSADEFRVESTIHGSEATADSAGGVEHLTVDVSPDGDEIVVAATTDGESAVVHRERSLP